ncbi:hypothetical protein P7K49_034017 [Saguinus oedipus]|uniref:Uncharacterized protein n=1 Tax=Saguinus oedipus TaxID=9490 RepID=A0ABQ9TUD5_SAGOE|nr:hypothetical protein P7K49_034017 [Saguinus oedipus]
MNPSRTVPGRVLLRTYVLNLAQSQQEPKNVIERGRLKVDTCTEVSLNSTTCSFLLICEKTDPCQLLETETVAKSKCVGIGVKSSASSLLCQCLQAKSDLLNKREVDPSHFKVCFRNTLPETRRQQATDLNFAFSCRGGLNQGDMKVHAFPKYSEEAVRAEGVGGLKWLGPEKILKLGLKEMKDMKRKCACTSSALSSWATMTLQRKGGPINSQNEREEPEIETKRGKASTSSQGPRGGYGLAIGRYSSPQARDCNHECSGPGLGLTDSTRDNTSDVTGLFGLCTPASSLWDRDSVLEPTPETVRVDQC